MPSSTFLNLPKEKQNSLLTSAKKEFSRTSFSEASINRIIIDAHIPRGSFYMYFEDKEDLYFYLLEEYKKKLFNLFLTKLEESKGDVTLSWEKLYTDIVNYCEENDTAFFKNIFLNMRFTSEKRIIISPSKEERENIQKEILSRLNKDLYSTKEKDKLLNAVQLIMMITTSSLAYIFNHPEEKSKEVKLYLERLHIIRYGIMKNKGGN